MADSEKERLVGGMPENGAIPPTTYTQPPRKKCNMYTLVAMVSVGTVAAIAAVAIYVSTSGPSKQTAGSNPTTFVTAITNLTPESQWRLEDWGRDINCSQEGQAVLSNEYFDMTETQLITFATGNTQKHRLDSSLRDNHYVYRPRYIRKEIRQMTDTEWDNYAKAVLALANTYPGGDLEEQSEHRNFSIYQMFSALHNTASSPNAHFGLAFLPWHREFLMRFERLLREQYPDVTIPYWDSSLDGNLPDPRESYLFSPHFFGNLKGNVTTGRFANFPTIPGCACFGHNLVRDVLDQNTLYTREYYDALALIPEFKYTDAAFGELYGVLNMANNHGLVHIWIGGHSGTLSCAPTEPLFWNHHAMVDLLFEEFRLRHPNYTEQYYDGIYANDPTKKGHMPYEPMTPFEPMVNIEGMSDVYTSVYYTHSQRPSKILCTSDLECGSKYLWCDTANQKCTSKVYRNCTGLGDNACYCNVGRPTCARWGSCLCV